MYDLHCHLLPGIDDGPADLETSLAMARLAVANGITHAVLTPHIHPERYSNSRASVTHAAAVFRADLAAADIPLQIGIAGEVRLSAEILAWVEESAIPFLGEWQGDKVMLLELPHGHVPPGSDKLAAWLLERHIRPMIAHPERNKGIMRDRAQLEPFLDMGCLIQLTAGSVAGQFGAPAQQCAEALLSEGVVTILASDAHNLKVRVPDLMPGLAHAISLIGEDAANQLVHENPQRLAACHFS